MKKKIIFATSLIFVIVLGVIGFKMLVDKKEDVVLESVDEKTEFAFKEITKERTWKNGDYRICFKLAEDIDFYNEYIKDNLDFISFIDGSGNISKEKTDNYLFCKDEHYFYVTNDDFDVIIYELISCFYTDIDAYYVYVPFVGELVHNEVNNISYDQLIGVKSFEDLVEYYKRIPSDNYIIDEENQTIYLTLNSLDRKIEKGCVVKITDAGLDITLMEKYQ